MSRWSHSTANNSSGLTPSQTGGHNCNLKQNLPGEGGVGQMGERYDNRIGNANFYIVFHSNYGSVLLSFRDITTG